MRPFGAGEIPSAAVQLALTAKVQKIKTNPLFFLSKRSFQDPQCGIILVKNHHSLKPQKFFFLDKAQIKLLL